MAKEQDPLSKLRSLYGRPETEYLDTGNFLLNELMGGGMPTGKFIEFHGLEGTGKTTIILQFLNYMIRKHGVKVLYMDVESALEDSLKDSIGISEFESDDANAPSFLHLSPGTYPEIAKVLAYTLDSPYHIVVWDSVANSAVDINTNDDDDEVISKKLGQDALQQTNLMKAFKNKFGRHGKTLIVVQQMRKNIQLTSFRRGAEHKPAGGKAYDHNLDIRFALSKGAWLVDSSKERIGAELSLITIKNKMTFPFRKVDAELYFAKGIDRTKALMEVMLKKGIAIRGGSSYRVEGLEHEKLHGKEALKVFVREHYGECVRLIGDFADRVDIEGEPLENEAS